MIDEVTDQASEQSVMERLASKFVPTQETETAVAEVAADLAELELDGQVYQVPVKLKDAFMKNDDYTKKTQDLAEQRKTLDHVRTMAETRQLEASFYESIAGETKRLNVIEAYLEQASKVDWSQMNAEQMFRQRIELDQIKEQRDALKQIISDKRGSFQSDMQARIADLRGKSRELASKSIDNFSDETEKSMRAFAAAEGLADKEMDNVFLDPRSFKIVWKAMQYDKIQKGTVKATESVGKVLKAGAASERMPAAKVNDLNFRKAMKAASTSGQKAEVIEERLSNGLFGSKRR